MVRRAALVAVFVAFLFGLAALYVGGVASLADWVVHLVRPGPNLSPAGAATSDEWVLFAETAHFRYYVRPHDQIPRWAMELAEDHLHAACVALQLDFSGVIPFYKHPSQLDLFKATGSSSTGLVLAAEDGSGAELHSVHPYDPHEVTHVLAHQMLGEPPAFFDEGLATAFGWDWTPNETGVHERASQLYLEGRLVGLERLLANWDFRSYKSYPAYAAAGSFIKYLLATDGPGKLAQLFKLDKYSPAEDIKAHFEAAYGKSVYEVETSWRLALQAGELSSLRSAHATKDSVRSLVVTGATLFMATFLGATLLIIGGEKAIAAASRKVHGLGRSVGRRSTSAP